MTVEMTDSRRLTGPNLLLDGPGAILEVAVSEEDDLDQVIASWAAMVRELVAAMGWPDPTIAVRHHDDGGASLAYTAPIDVLYTACELNEVALDVAIAQPETTAHGGNRPGAGEVERLRAEAVDEANPTLLALQAAAVAKGVAFLWDDDEVSLGLGTGSRTWPVTELPNVDEVDWASHHDIPVVLVTGTNGKSTTVRMLATILQGAGWETGLTSTDGIRVGTEVVDPGDWSGPGGARLLLRHTDVEAGVLEVARGGILRRGLPISPVDVAVVTNVARDHLGEYGINDLDDLTQAKLVVAKAIDQAGLLVLNADDDHLVRHAPEDVPTSWCSQSPDNPVVLAHVASGGTAWIVVDEVIVARSQSGDRAMAAVADIPATLGGAARHNVANALGAVAAADFLGVQPTTIATGLTSFRGDLDDNPGRANMFELDGRTLIVDFAHNPAGMTAITQAVSRMPASRRLVLFSQAGDRSDRDIRELTERVWATGPDHVVAAEVPTYLRGREPGEVPDLIASELHASGAAPGQVTTAQSPMAGVRAALDWSQPGDLLLLLVLEQRDAITTMLSDRGAVVAA